MPVHKRSVDIGDDDSYTYIDDMSDYNNMLKKAWAQVKLPNFPLKILVRKWVLMETPMKIAK